MSENSPPEEILMANAPNSIPEESLVAERYLRAMAHAESLREELLSLRLRRVVVEGLATLQQRHCGAVLQSEDPLVSSPSLCPALQKKREELHECEPTQLDENLCVSETATGSESRGGRLWLKFTEHYSYKRQRSGSQETLSSVEEKR